MADEHAVVIWIATLISIAGNVLVYSPSKWKSTLGEFLIVVALTALTGIGYIFYAAATNFLMRALCVFAVMAGGLVWLYSVMQCSAKLRKIIHSDS